MSVRIYWTPNSEPDISKYNIYRQDIKTGEITRIDEVMHPTCEYIDTNGSSDYRYFVSAVDEAGNESPLAGPVRLPPDNTTCQIYDSFKMPSGSPASGRTILFKIISLPYNYAGSCWSGQVITCVTDSDGNLEVFLPRGAKVQVTSSEFGFSSIITIPDAATSRLADLLGS